MNDTIARIIEDARRNAESADKEIADATEQIESATAWLKAAEQRKAEYLEVIEKLGGGEEVKPMKLVETPIKHKVRWMNTDNLNVGTSVEVHAPDCADFKKKARHPFADTSGIEEWESAQKFAEDYNADVYEEDGLDGAWPITFHQCSGLVEKKTTLKGYEGK